MVANLASTCQQHNIPPQIVVITDSNVAPHYLKPIETHLRRFQFNVTSIVVPPGERQKSLTRANAIFTELLRQNVGRRSAVIALGGGVIGDLAGFVAATYHRGITLIQAPTTLLSQVDSSVGGKVAVNHPLGKNMIGAFFQPKFVWADIDCLRTLPAREVVCGLGEIVKYGVIWDEGLFKYIEDHLEEIMALETEAILHVQARCCEIKAHVTSRDERESGLRMILNFGHTVGHALEAAGKYRLLKHGEAVLVGMMAESFISKELGTISVEVHDRILNLVRRIPIKARYHLLSVHTVMRAMMHDKKAVGGRKRFMLPTRLGEVKAIDNVEESLVRASLHKILQERNA